MLIRKAEATDVTAMHAIRLRVRENRLSDPSVVQEQDYHDFMRRDTGSWVCELNGSIVAFVMVDVEKKNLWALFVAPEHEFKGVGRALHDTMLEWYRKRADRLRLTTDPKTRAAEFYARAGYADRGLTPNGRESILELLVAKT
ncbi:MAG: GNAT family N-acetyltransferase [Flavobacteriales bacterium]